MSVLNASAPPPITAEGDHAPMIAYEYLEPRTFAWRWTLATLLTSTDSPALISAGDTAETGGANSRVVRVLPWRMAGRIAPLGGLADDDSEVVLAATLGASVHLGGGSRDKSKDSNSSPLIDGGDGSSDPFAGAARRARLSQRRQDAKTGEGRRLAEEMAVKQAAIEAQMEEIKAHMQTLREEHEAAAAQQAKAEADLAVARSELIRAREQVEKIDPRNLKEIQSYRTPPAVVQHVMTAVFNVLGNIGSALSGQVTLTSQSLAASDAPASSCVSSTATSAAPATGTTVTSPSASSSAASMPALMLWPDIVSRMRHPAFLSTVLAFDPERDLPADRRAKLCHRYIRRPSFDYADAMKGSQAIGDLYNWVVRQLEATSAASQLEEFRKSRGVYEAEAAQKRSQLAAAAAELDAMEEELEGLEDAYAEAETAATAAAIGATGGGGGVDLNSTAATTAPSDGTASPTPDLTSPANRSLGLPSTARAEGTLAATRAANTQDTRALLRGVRKSWVRPAAKVSNIANDGTSVTMASTCCILRSSVLCKLGDSPKPGAVVTLDEQQQQILEAALRARYADRNCGVARVGEKDREAEQHPQKVVASADTTHYNEKASADVPGAAAAAEQQAAARHKAELAGLQAQLAALLAELPDSSTTSDGNDWPTSPHSSSGNDLTAAETVAAITTRVHALRNQLQARANEQESARSSPAKGGFTCRRDGSALLRPPPNALTSSTVTHRFAGDEWPLVLADTEEDLRRAIVSDIAAICGVPGRAVSGLQLRTGSLLVTATVEHATSLTVEDLQAALDAGAYPETDAIYDARHTRRAAREVEARHHAEQAALLAHLELELATVAKEKQALGKRLAMREEQLARREAELSEAQTTLTTQRSDMQRLVTQSSSQAEVMDELREQLAFRDTVRKTEELQQMLQDKEEQLVAADAMLREKEHEVELSQKRAERRFRLQLEAEHSAHEKQTERLRQALEDAVARQAELEQRIANGMSGAEPTAEAAAVTDAAQATVAALAREKVAEAQATAAEAVTRAEALAAEKAEAESRLRDTEQELRSLREARAPVTTHHTHTFPGNEWDGVLEDSHNRLERTLRYDIAAVCGVPSNAVGRLQLARVPLAASFDVTHHSELSKDMIDTLLREGEYPSVDELYRTRIARRVTLAAGGEEPRETQQRLRKLTAKQKEERTVNGEERGAERAALAAVQAEQGDREEQVQRLCAAQAVLEVEKAAAIVTKVQLDEEGQALEKSVEQERAQAAQLASQREKETARTAQAAKDAAERESRLHADCALVTALEESLRANAFAVTFCTRESATLADERTGQLARQTQRQAEADQVRQAMVELTSAVGNGSSDANGDGEDGNSAAAAIAWKEARIVRDLAALLRAAEEDAKSDQRTVQHVEKKLLQLDKSISEAQKRVDAAEAARKALRDVTRMNSKSAGKSESTRKQQTTKALNASDGEGKVESKSRTGGVSTEHDDLHSERGSDSEEDGDKVQEDAAMDADTTTNAFPKHNRSHAEREQQRREKQAFKEACRASKARITSLREAAKAQRREWKEQSEQLSAARQATLEKSRSFLEKLKSDLAAPPGAHGDAKSSAHGITKGGSDVSSQSAAMWRSLYDEATRQARGDSLWMHVCFGGVVLAAMATLQYRRFGV